MKRALALLVGGVLILGSALAAHAQAPTVSFGGVMRVYGFAMDNFSDFKSSDGTPLNRDSNSVFFQRWRLFTNVESADKKAKAVWAVEVGDITWGQGGGANAGSYLGCPGQTAPIPGTTVTIPPPAGSPPGTPGTVIPVPAGAAATGNRVGNGSGGCTGADGVNVETKHAYLSLNTSDWVPGTSAVLGIQYLGFMTGPLGDFAGDDMAGIALNWKGEMVDVQAWYAKAGEGNSANADDTDLWAVRVGANITKDLRLTLEGLMMDERSMPGQSIGDSFWIGATVGAKIGDIGIDGQFVYGQRAIQSTGTPGSCGTPCTESGFGAFLMARIPVGALTVNALGWYTTGDDSPTRGPGSGSGAATRIAQDSDKLPLVHTGGSYFNGGGPYMAEWLLGLSTTGNACPGGCGDTFGDPTGTYGLGASVIYSLTPALSVGGGVAYVGASDADSPDWGASVVEIDAGLTYRFNPNTVMNLFAAYGLPDSGDDAWGVLWRTQFSF
jgi:hypothetical protein